MIYFKRASEVIYATNRVTGSLNLKDVDGLLFMAADQAQRPCPFCAEQVKTEAITCRFCQQNISVDLIFEGSTTPRELHRIAIDLLNFKPGLFSYKQLKSLLPGGKGTIASGLSYSFACKLLNAVDVAPLKLSIEQTLPQTISADVSIVSDPEGHATTRRSFAWVPTFASLALLALLVFALLYTMRGMKNEAHKQEIVSANVAFEAKQQSFKAPNIKDEMIHEPESKKKIQEALIRATATIYDGNTVGSGFFIRSDGYVITNAHVVENMNNPKIGLENGNRYDARIEKVDRELDLALLKVNGTDFPTLRLGDATLLSRGDTVWTVGAPHGLNFTLTKGIISYAGRNMNGIAYLQTDAPINSGNSGGPMINEKGHVVGVNTFIIRGASGLGFALPINYLYMSPSPFLAGIRESLPPHQRMQKWLAYAQREGTRGYTATAPSQKEQHSNTHANQSNSMLNSLLGEGKRIDSKYQLKIDRLNSDIATLTTKKTSIEGTYYGDKSASLSISQEEELGQQLKNISQSILKKRITLAENMLKYCKAKEKNLKQSLAYANSRYMTDQINNALQTVTSTHNKSSSDKNALESQLASLLGQTY